MAAYYKNVGNTARVINTEPDAKQKAPVKAKRRRSVVFVYRNDHRHKMSALTVITLMLIFAGAAGAIAASANVSIAKARVDTLTNELREIQTQNKALEEEAQRYDDAAAMKKAAQDKGMSDPAPYQIRNINVPEENYAEYNKPNK